MNYDRVIVELLDRISKLEEKTERLEQALMQQSAVGFYVGEAKEPKTRDKTKYIFDGKTCLKNRLVLEVVREYSTEHTGITFDGLQEVFYDKLQGSFGVVRKKDAVESKKQIRYFFKDDDTIILDDGTKVVVSNQWDKDNIKAFIVFVKSIGYEIQEI